MPETEAGRVRPTGTPLTEISAEPKSDSGGVVAPAAGEPPVLVLVPGAGQRDNDQCARGHSADRAELHGYFSPCDGRP
ncbi:hypothetical protein ACWC9R_27795 [Streptomyces sp. NPDC001219]